MAGLERTKGGRGWMLFFKDSTFWYYLKTWLADPKSFLKAPSVPIYTNFEKEAQTYVFWACLIKN